MKERSFYFDNIKFVLIFLVVLGHFADSYKSYPIMQALAVIIYSFHMPVFVFISGHFSKNISTQRKSDLTILFIYILFQAYNELFTKFVGLGAGGFSFLSPIYANWYLLALFLWRTALPYFKFFNKTKVILFSFLCMFLVGFNTEISSTPLHRIIYFTPYFLLGYYADDFKTTVNKYARYQRWFVLLFSVLMTGLFVISLKPGLGPTIYNAYLPYKGYISFGNLKYGLIARLAGTCSTFVISWCLFYLIPDKETRFSKFGRNTLFVYLFHMFIVWPIASIPYMRYYTELYGIIASMAISYLLSLPVVIKILDEVVHFGKLSKLLKFKSRTKQVIFSEQ